MMETIAFIIILSLLASATTALVDKISPRAPHRKCKRLM